MLAGWSVDTNSGIRRWQEWLQCSMQEGTCERLFCV